MIPSMWVKMWVFTLYEYSKFSPKEIEEQVEESLANVELHGIQKLMPSELSGG